MKLRTQLVALGLLTLAFPVAGWFLFQSMHRDIQHAIGQSALIQARTLAGALQKQLNDGHLPAGLPVAALPVDMQADGSADDWGNVAPMDFPGRVIALASAEHTDSDNPSSPPVPPRSQLRVGKDGSGNWWLWLRVFDPSRNLPAMEDGSESAQSQPDPAPHAADRLTLGLVVAGYYQRLVFNRQPEGRLRLAYASPGQPTLAWQGRWHELADGYSVEMQLPATLQLQRLGFAARDGAAWPVFQALTGTLSEEYPDRIVLQPLLDDTHPLTVTLRQLFEQSGKRPGSVRIVNADGWILARAGSPQSRPEPPWQWLQGWLYQKLFAAAQTVPEQPWQNRWTLAPAKAKATTDSPQLLWQHHGSTHSNSMVAQVPLGDGWLILKTPLSDEQQSLMNTLLRGALIAFGLVAILILLYWLYAHVLAWRVRRLSQALQQALDAKGRLRTALPSQRADDEIGELSRGMGRLLEQVRDHTLYLQTFGSRLSHELKTPLAIVQGALDNLQAETQASADNTTGIAGRKFLARARDGTSRLRFILNQLASLSRLQSAVNEAPLQPLELRAFLRDYADTQRQLIPQLRLQVPDKPVIIPASVELLAQALDKLLDNARDFSSADGLIELKLEEEKQHAVISVFNSGSQLPAGVEPDALFDTLTSHRPPRGKSRTQNTTPAKTHHLGLGLYLARLIAGQHNGFIRAYNREHPRGVTFALWLSKRNR